MRDIQNKLQVCQIKMSDVNNQLAVLNNAIADAMEAKCYWTESQNSVKSGSCKTDVIEHLVKCGEEKLEQSKVSQSDGMKRQVNKFDELWSKAKDVLNEAILKKVSVSFKCTHCLLDSESLPYIKNKNFICEKCFC